MQNCLETIADAVLQVVLFQVEADENQSHLVSPDVSPLVEGVKLLVSLAQQKAMQWTETEEQQNQGRMLEQNEILKRSTLEIAKLLIVLKNDFYNQQVNFHSLVYP